MSGNFRITEGRTDVCQGRFLGSGFLYTRGAEFQLGRSQRLVRPVTLVKRNVQGP